MYPRIRSTTVPGEGVFTADRQVEYPGEATEPFENSDHWSAPEDVLVLTTADGTGQWSVDFDGGDVTLRLGGSGPKNLMAFCCWSR
jgi:hypothetical protein